MVKFIVKNINVQIFCVNFHTHKSTILVYVKVRVDCGVRMSVMNI